LRMCSAECILGSEYSFMAESPVATLLFSFVK
jgi:hypothetical protein